MPHGGPHGLFDKIGGGVQTLFGGRNDPRITPEQNRAASSDALVNAGLATLLAQGPDGVSPTLLQALSQGALTGREAGTAARETSLQRNQQAVLQGLVDSGEVGPEALERLFMEAIATGNVEAMRALSGVLPAALSTTNSSVNGMTVDVVDPSDSSKVIRQLIDRTNGSVIATLGEAPKSGSNAARPRVTLIGPDGERKAAFFLNSDGTKEFIGYTESEQGTAQERMNSRLGEAGFQAAQLLELVDTEMTNWRATVAARGGVFTAGVANLTLDDDQQAAVAASANFINPVVRYLSGAQMTDKEAQRYYNALIPSVGDNPRTVLVKRAMRNNIIRAMGEGQWEGVAVDGEANIANADAWLADATARAQASVGGFDTTSGSATDALRN